MDRALPDTVPVIALLALYIVLAVLLVAHGFGPPLTRVHGDGPIHLYQAKRLAETPLVRSYIRHAGEVAEQVDGRWPAGEGFSESYWRFTRFGHIALLGTLVGLLGSDTSVISVAHWLYVAMMIGALAFTAHMTIELLVLLRTPVSANVLGWSVVASSGTYALSPMFGYVGSSLISEAPAILCLAAGSWVLVRAVARSSVHFAAVSGLFAFLSYAIRMESIWVIGALALALALSPIPATIRTGLWRVYVVAGAAALALYVTYCLIFWPLTDPRLYLLFAKNHDALRLSGVPWFLSLSSAIAFGWVGVLGSIAAQRWASARFALLWGLLCLVPSLPFVLSGFPIQSRQFSPMMLPVVVASTVGWAYLADRALAKRQISALVMAAAPVVFFAVVAYPYSYRIVREIPGLWRLAALRQGLVPAAYEQLTYPYRELREISRTLYQANPNGRAVVVWPAPGHIEQLNLIRFFGPSYSRDADLALVTDPTNPQDCDSSLPTVPHEPLIFCTTITTRLLQELAAGGVPVFNLKAVQTDAAELFYLRQVGRAGSGVPEGTRRTIVETHEHFALERLSAAARQ